MRALSHGERRRFVRACLGEEKAAGELAGLSKLALASVSEHLKVLRKSGLLHLKKRGRFWFYQTDRRVVRRAAAAIRQLTSGETR